MNILIPDKWLREYLVTEATPKQLKEYVSLCGPSIERINTVDGEIVYDIEVTTNRPDSMSVVGIAREAAAILPRFNVEAHLKNDPYNINTAKFVNFFVNRNVNPSISSGQGRKKINIKTDPELNPRWTSVVIDTVTVKPSPQWLQELLTLTGIRPINNIVDITNYIMRAYGQPTHAFNYDAIGEKNGIPTMILRASKKGEHIITLDDKTHKLPGGDIVIEDGKGRLIDLCGIMGAKNSSITEGTKTIVLFMQTYAPDHIRKTSMTLAHRTEAAGLFEKGLDPELVLPAIITGIDLVKDLAGGEVVSQLYDLYPKPYVKKEAVLKRAKADAYMGIHLSDTETKNILTSLGIETRMTKDEITVKVPSFRQDVEIDVDIIEEIARMYGYHTITTKLPDTEPPIVLPDQTLSWEETIKIRLRDWGFTETYTYSMISEELMTIFNLEKKNTYKISNPLSSEWVYMRPHLLPSMLTAIAQNMHIKNNLKLFELSMVYEYRYNDIPYEKPVLIIAATGNEFSKMKGIAHALFDVMNITTSEQGSSDEKMKHDYFEENIFLPFAAYGHVGLIKQSYLTQLGIKSTVTVLELDFGKMVEASRRTKKYQPIPKHPPVIEDLSFTFPARTRIGDVMNAIKSISTAIFSVTLIDQFEDSSAFRIEYLHKEKILESKEVEALRQEIIVTVTSHFSAELKGKK